MMTIDFDVVIEDRMGRPIKDGDRDLTLGVACAIALEADSREERELGGAEKVRRKRLADRVYPGGQVNLTVEDIALLKKVTGNVLTIYVTGVVWDLLDPPVA